MQMVDDMREAILARLERLERNNRRLRFALGGAIAAGAALALVGFANHESMQSVQREIQTQRLVIVGADQQPRVMLQGNSDGSALFLYGPDRPKTDDGAPPAGGGAGGGGVSGGFTTLAPRLRLMVEGEECRIELIAPGGKTRAKLRYNADGPALELLDEEGNQIED